MEQNLPERKKRKRIPIPKNLLNVEPDPLEWKPNKCSPNTRHIEAHECNMTFDIHVDQHYMYRQTIGEDNGEKREHIENDIVMALVRKSIKHMIFYSAYIKGFSFINHEPEAMRATRVVLMTPNGDCMLNVVIECHRLGVSHVEITVKTAICQRDYQPSDNQYVVEIDGNNSTLYFNSKRGFEPICTF